MAIRFLPLLFLCFISPISGSTENAVKYLSLHNPSSPTKSQTAVSVEIEDLHQISRSLIAAETWLRDRVFPYYPSSKISTIVVGLESGSSVFCTRNLQNEMGFVLPSMKNIFHSLTRWGLEGEIKVSAAFSSNCLSSFSSKSRDDFVVGYVKPVLSFLQESNSSYVVNTFHSFSIEQGLKLAMTHFDSFKTLGDFGNINVLIARNLQNPPAFSPVYEPQPNIHIPPIPANPPHWGYNNNDLPPCNPWNGGVKPTPVPAPGPGPGPAGGLWCVAKASVPVEMLQEAMDYACGEGGGDCEAIQGNGRCFEPDNVLAHASYAFNSYWQKYKKIGGSCSFGGTAILVNSDPSFSGCRFDLS